MNYLCKDPHVSKVESQIYHTSFLLYNTEPEESRRIQTNCLLCSLTLQSVLGNNQALFISVYTSSASKTKSSSLQQILGV